MGIINRLTSSFKAKPEEPEEPEEDEDEDEPGDITRTFNTTLEMMAVTADELAAQAVAECEGIRAESRSLAQTLSGIHSFKSPLPDKPGG